MLSFEGKAILAPMVRISSLPMRMLALDYGADVVFLPEIVDKKIISTKRIENKLLGTVDFIDNKNSLVFRTTSEEKTRLVFQVGSSDPELALIAAKHVASDVAGIDLNCGCPKHFSVHAGMGAALLKTPEKLTSILKKLVTESGLPVSAKIRMLPDTGQTIELVKGIISTGIHALAIHCRTPECRTDQVPAQHERLAEIISTIRPTIPIIINGDIWTREQGIKLMQTTGASGFMMARAAQWNASCFSNVQVDLQDISRQYLQYCITYSNSFASTKYALQEMWQGEQARLAQLATKEPFKYGHSTSKKKPDRMLMHMLQKSKCMQDLCQLFELSLQDSMSFVNQFGHEETELVC